MCNNIEHSDLHVFPKDSTANNINWKNKVKEKIDSWLQTLPEFEDDARNDTNDNDIPDLFSFYAELSALRSDFKTGTRKSQDSLLVFGDVLDVLKTSLDDLKSKQIQLEQTNSIIIKETLIKPLITIFIRFQRIINNLKTPVRTSFLSFRNPHKEILNRNIEGFSLVFAHLKKLLEKEGVVKTDCLGQIFDPHTMIAIATKIASENCKPETVVEEISPGFIFKDKILLLAKVKVAIERE